MDFSIFLAKALGLYLLIVSLSMLINKSRMPAIINGIIENPGLQLIMGLHILVIGILLVLSHNLWSGETWQIVITVIAWIVLVKGIINFSLPVLARTMSKSFLASTGMFYFSLLINFLLGLYLCYYGFMLGM